MRDYNYDNVEIFLSLKPKHHYFIIFIALSLLGILVSLHTFKTYDVKEVKAYYKCDDVCQLLIQSDVETVGKISKMDEIKLEKNNIKFDHVLVSDILADETIKNNVQVLTITIAKQDLVNNTFQDVQIYFNKERLIKKIWQYFFK